MRITVGILTKPGLTGLWQVSGRKAVDWDERMRMDLNYVEHWSPALDSGDCGQDRQSGTHRQWGVLATRS